MTCQRGLPAGKQPISTGGPCNAALRLRSSCHLSAVKQTFRHRQATVVGRLDHLADHGTRKLYAEEAKSLAQIRERGTCNVASREQQKGARYVGCIHVPVAQSHPGIPATVLFPPWRNVRPCASMGSCSQLICSDILHATCRQKPGTKLERNEVRQLSFSGSPEKNRA